MSIYIYMHIMCRQKLHHKILNWYIIYIYIFIYASVWRANIHIPYGYGSKLSIPVIGWLILKTDLNLWSPRSLILTHTHIHGHVNTGDLQTPSSPTPNWAPTLWTRSGCVTPTSWLRQPSTVWMHGTTDARLVVWLFVLFSSPRPLTPSRWDSLNLPRKAAQKE